MSRTMRHIVSVVALAALIQGLGQMHPCIDQDSCPSACAADQAASLCPASGDGHDHDPLDSVCDCPCHQPLMASVVPEGPSRIPPISWNRESAPGMDRPGFPHPPFRPPTL